MGRQRRPKGLKLPPLPDGIGEAALKKALNIAVVFIFLAAVFFLAKAFIQRSDYFDLRAVDVRGMNNAGPTVSVTSETMRAYKGRNIFNIDLKAIGRTLQYRYPDAREVLVLRTLPDTLTIIFNFRKPVAVIISTDGRRYPVDGRSFLVLNLDEKQLKGLPAITGVSVRYGDAAARRSDSKNLKYALELLAEIQKTRFMSKYVLSRIDAVDPRAMAFYLEDGLEVRIGNEHFRERLGILRKTLRDPRIVRDRIKYVDLRFDEDVVIGPK